MAAIRERDKFFELDGNGRLLVNTFRRDVLPVKLAFDTVLPNNSYPITISASGTPTPPKLFKQPLNLAQNSRLVDIGNPFMWQSGSFEDSTDGTASSNFSIFMKNNGTGRALMNFPIHIRTVMGTAQLPTILREPYYFTPNDQLAVYLNKISGSTSTARFYMNGTQYCAYSTSLLGRGNKAAEDVFKRIRQWRERSKYVMPYWQSPNFLNTDGSGSTTLSGNTTANFDSIIPEDSHFEAFTIMAVSTGNFGLQIAEVKTKRLLMNGQITKTNAIGTNTYPTILPVPYLIPAGYRLRYTLTDLSGSTNTIWICMHGRRIYAPLRDVKEVIKDTALVRSSADEETQFVPAPLV